MGERGCVLDLDREKDPNILRQAAKILERENQRLVDRNVDLTRRLLAAEGRDPAELQTEIARLEAQLAVARKRLFGASSERRPSTEPRPALEREPHTGHGPREQREVAVVEEIHVLDEPDRICPSCGQGSKLRRGTEVAALFYSLVESAKLAGVESRAYMRAAAAAALRGERVPLPHEIAAAA